MHEGSCRQSRALLSPDFMHNMTVQGEFACVCCLCVCALGCVDHTEREYGAVVCSNECVLLTHEFVCVCSPHQSRVWHSVQLHESAPRPHCNTVDGV